MTDEPFDRRLGDALRAYASDAPTIWDAAGFAATIARQHPRRAGWPGGPVTRTVGWVLLGAALILATVIALGLAVGGRPPSEPLPQLPLARGALPAELFGVRTAGTYSLDVNDEFLLRTASGEPLEWAGSAAEYVPVPGQAGDLVVRAGGACGEGRYAVRTGVPPSGGIPAPSASGGNPTPIAGLTSLDLIANGEPFVLAPVADACADRVAILTSGPWEPKRVELVAGNRYDSMSFTESFEFVMPATDPRIPPATESSLAKGVLRIGNGYSWSSSFHDDVPVFSDVCDTGSRVLEDVPATPEDVGAWLRSSPGLSIVEDPIEISVDGRTALAFVPVEGCASFDPPLGGTQFNLGSIVFAIPTGTDTILYVVGGDGGDEPSDAEIAQELVRSMTFR